MRLSGSIRFLLLTAVVAALAVPAPLAAPVRLEGLVPSDVDLVLVVEDVPGLRGGWPDLPLVRAWNDPELRRLVGFGGERGLPDPPGWIDGSDPDHPASRLLETITGQVMLVLPDISAWSGDGESAALGLPPGMVLLADVAGRRDEAVALLSAPPEGADPGVDTGLGLPPETWRVAGDVLILGARGEDTAAAAEWIGGRSGRPSLAAGAGHSALARRGGADIQIIANLEPLMDRLVAALEEESAGEAAPDNPLGITPTAVVRALGLDVMQGAWLGLRLMPDRTEADYGLTFSEERGLVRLMALRPLGAGKRIPLPESAIDASVFALDVDEFWQGLRDILTVLSPVLAAGVDAQLAQLSAQVGIDLNAAIPGAFAGQFAGAAFMHAPDGPGAAISPEDLEDMAGQIWVADLSKDHALDRVMEALSPMLGAAGMREEVVPLAGRSLHVVVPPEIPTGNGDESVEPAAVSPDAGSAEEDPERSVVAWSIDDSHLVTGQGRLSDFVAVLEQLDARGEGIWRRKDVKAALAGLPGDPAGLQFQDSAGALAGVFHSLAAVSRGVGAEQPALDADGLAEVLGRYFTTSAGAAYRRPGEIAVTFHVRHGAP